MSTNMGNQPRHIANGKYEHKCDYCGVTFRDNNQRTKYCTFEHKQKANNQKFYKNHRREIILRVMLRRHRKPKQSTARTPAIDQMTNEELLEFVRNNPHAIQVRKRG